MFEDKNESHNFLKFICYENKNKWANTSLNLFYSAEILYEFETLKIQHVFDSNYALTGLFNKNLTDRSYFNHNIQRMLWAYGFECLFKSLILEKEKQLKKKHGRYYEKNKYS